MNGQKSQNNAFSKGICRCYLFLLFCIILATTSCEKIPLIASQTETSEHQGDTQQNVVPSLGLAEKIIYVQLGLTVVLILLVVWLIIRQNRSRSKNIESMSQASLGKIGMSEALLEYKLDSLTKLSEQALNDIRKRRINLGFGSIKLQVQKLGEILREAKEISSKLPKVEDKGDAKSENGDILGKKLASMESKLDSLSKIVTQSSTNAQIPWNKPQASSVSFKLSNIVQEICNAYNNAVKNPRLQEEFMKEYNPIRIGVVNSMKRARDPKLAPEFKAVDFGDYYAVAVENDKRYAVLPVLGLPLRDVNYEAGYMGSVFECPNYNPKLYYNNVQVIRPAFFETDSGKSQWFFKDKGLLNLGQGLSQV